MKGDKKKKWVESNVGLKKYNVIFSSFHIPLSQVLLEFLMKYLN